MDGTAADKPGAERETASYRYDADGLRLEKTANGVTTEYQYVNGQLLGEKRSNGVILRYTYDALGVLSGMEGITE